MLVKEGLKTKAKDKKGVPDPKKLERTGDKSFVIKADGGNYFEGVVTDPGVKFVPSKWGSATTIRGCCLKKCLNRDKKCITCFRFSAFIEDKCACN